MKYYGFMVCELDGNVEKLECDCDFKPAHETSGFSYAKWFTDEEKRNNSMNFAINTIKEYQLKNKTFK